MDTWRSKVADRLYRGRDVYIGKWLRVFLVLHQSPVILRSKSAGPPTSLPVTVPSLRELELLRSSAAQCARRVPVAHIKRALWFPGVCVADRACPDHTVVHQKSTSISSSRNRAGTGGNHYNCTLGPGTQERTHRRSSTPFNEQMTHGMHSMRTAVSVLIVWVRYTISVLQSITWQW